MLPESRKGRVPPLRDIPTYNVSAALFQSVTITGVALRAKADSHSPGYELYMKDQIALATYAGRRPDGGVYPTE
jgi:hypothetical protein